MVGAEHAPNLVGFLEQQGVSLSRPAPADPEASVRTQEMQVIIRIPETIPGAMEIRQAGGRRSHR